MKHERIADCVVGGYRLHKTGDDLIGSLLLGLFNAKGELASVGVIGAFPMATRKAFFEELQPLVTSFEGHPWDWSKADVIDRNPHRNEVSRWNAGKDLSFVPLRPERVVKVRYDYMEGERFRHRAVRALAARPGARSCTYERLERLVTFNLADVLSGE